MAIDTLRNRALERRTGMATFAGNIQMSAIQGKAGAEVIKRLLGERG